MNASATMAHNESSVLYMLINGTMDNGNLTHDANATAVSTNGTAGGDSGVLDVCTQINVYVFPIQFILCVIGNILNLLILTRDRVTTSRQVYILSLSVTDLIYFISQFSAYMDANHIHVDYTHASSNILDVSIKYFGGLWYWWQSAFFLASDLILMAFCIERCIAITRPFSRLGSGRSSTARRVVAIIVCFTLLHAWIQSYIYYRALVRLNQGMTSEEAGAQQNMPKWLSIWWSEFQLVHLVLIPMCVFVVLVLTTALILIALAKQRRYHRETLDRFQQREANVSRQYTFMLMAAVVTYFITCSLNFLLNVGDFIHTRFGVENWFGRKDIQEVLNPCQAWLSNWNYALNFVLYSFVSSKFRQNMRLLTRHGLRRWSSDSGDTAEDLLSPDGSVHTRRTSRASRNSSGDSRRSEWLQMSGSLHNPHTADGQQRGRAGSYHNHHNNGHIITGPLSSPGGTNSLNELVVSSQQRKQSNGFNGDECVRFRFGNGHHQTTSISNSSSSTGANATMLPPNSAPAVTATDPSPPPLSPPPSPPTTSSTHPNTTTPSPRPSNKSLSPFRRLKKLGRSSASASNIVGEYREMNDTNMNDDAASISERSAPAAGSSGLDNNNKNIENVVRRRSSVAKVSEHDHAELMKNEVEMHKRSEPE